MTKQYLTIDSSATELAVPESVTVTVTVTVTVGEIAADMQEGLLARAVGAGLQVMHQMDADVAAVCGPRSRHDPERRAVRHGQERGSVTLGGRRVPDARRRSLR